LFPIRHRGEQAQADLAVIRARAELVETRTSLINCARGMAKPMGERLQKCDAEQVKESLADGLSEALQKVLRPLLKSVEAISQQIAVYDRQIEEISKRYPEIRLLKPVYGVGPVIALAFVLTLEDAQRFEHSRDVGPFLGLQPRQRIERRHSLDFAAKRIRDTRRQVIRLGHPGAHQSTQSVHHFGTINLKPALAPVIRNLAQDHLVNVLEVVGAGRDSLTRHSGNSVLRDGGLCPKREFRAFCPCSSGPGRIGGLEPGWRRDVSRRSRASSCCSRTQSPSLCGCPAPKNGPSAQYPE
jgi:hypothetical protein